VLLNIVLATVPIPDIPWNVGSFPPLGLLYLAGGVKHFKGINVSLVDAFCEGLTVEQTVARVLACSPDMVGLSMASRNLREAARLLAELKSARPGLLTLAGGIHPTLFDELLLKEMPSLDLVLRGEADESFPELCRRWVAGEELAGVPGLSWRVNGEVKRGEPQIIEDLDSLPLPDRSILKPGVYGSQWYGFSLPILPRFTTASSSRGCLYNCTFCAGVKLCQNRLRTRSAGHVMAELVNLAQAGYEFVILFDDNFTGDVHRVDQLCHLIIEQQLPLSLAFAGTLNHLPHRTLRLMHQAGFDLVFVGVESGSDAQLRRYHKPSASHILAADITRAKQANIITIASFITGSKWESDSDHEATKDFIRRVRPHICEVNSLMAHPGSHLWDEVHPGEEPKTLEASESRLISRFPGQMPKAIIKFRERDFRRTYRRSWLHWQRLRELLDLYAHNRLFARVIKNLLQAPLVLLKFSYWGRQRD
jgi:anaerobic magnesium-protoporphyrin IX monomethyl ester cyclase